MDEREYEENELYEEIPEDDPVNNNEDEYGAGEDEASGAYDFDIPSQKADYSDEFEDEEESLLEKERPRADVLLRGDDSSWMKRGLPSIPTLPTSWKRAMMIANSSSS